MRKPFIAGNWKMNHTVEETLKFATALTSELKAIGQIDVAIAPPYTSLYSLGVAFTDTEFDLASQNIFWEDFGAYTAEISGTFLKEVGCKYAIIGHSERRQLFGETNQTVNKRINAALRHGLIPILCVGETLEERETNKTWDVIETQLVEGLNGIDLSTCADFVLAYEPIWAIGTGKTATKEQAEEVHGLIRKHLNEKFGSQVAQKTRILYGGSVKPENSRDLLAQENIDGALVGGASLDAKMFADIVRSAH